MTVRVEGTIFGRAYADPVGRQNKSRSHGGGGRNPSKSSSLIASRLWSCTVFRPGRFRTLLWFGEHSELQMLDDMLALASFCVLACVATL